jgi:UDP-N-acetyl-D-galactosamine dehydrogenase
MNELALIFDRLDIRTLDVLEAAGSKWNFHPFRPGLVGGHCIGVDPYYLTTKAEETGYLPDVILAGRRINNGIGAFLAQKCIKLLAQNKRLSCDAKIAIFGFTFKENVADIRNSRVPDIFHEFVTYGLKPQIVDPIADPEETFKQYQISLDSFDDVSELDALVLAVSHDEFLSNKKKIIRKLKPNGILIDVKSSFDPSELPDGLVYWSL